MPANNSECNTDFAKIITFTRLYKYSLGSPKKSPSTNIKDESKEFNFPEWYVKRDCDDEIREWLLRNPAGTLFVSGYRGVGKSICVVMALCKIEGCGANSKDKMPCYTEECSNHENKDYIGIEQIRINFTTIFTLNTLALIIISKIAERLDFYVPFPEKPRTAWTNLYKTALTGWIKWFSKRDKNNLELKSKIKSFHDKLIANVEITFNIIDGVSASVPPMKVEKKSSTSQTNRHNEMSDSEIISTLNEIIKEFVFVKNNDKKRVIFLFDEIDKLKGFHSEYQHENDKIKEFEELVGKIKYILANSYATFVFIAGRETFYRWQIDKSRGNSIYSSVFDFVINVEPFLGGARRNETQEMRGREMAQKDIDDIISKYLHAKYEMKSLSLNTDIYKSFKRYLLWKSRGIPRKIIHELEYIICLESGVKEKDQHCLYFDTSHIRRIKFYSSLVKELYFWCHCG